MDGSFKIAQRGQGCPYCAWLGPGGHMIKSQDLYGDLHTLRYFFLDEKQAEPSQIDLNYSDYPEDEIYSRYWEAVFEEKSSKYLNDNFFKF